VTDRDRDSEPRPRSVGAPSGLCCRTDAPSCNQSKGDPRQEQKQTRGMRMPFLGCGSFSAPDNVLPSALASAGQPFRPKVDYFKYVGTRAVVAILRVDAWPPSLPRRSRGSSRRRGADCGDDPLRPLPGLPKAPRPARGCRCQGRFTTGGRRAPLWGSAFSLTPCRRVPPEMRASPSPLHPQSPEPPWQHPLIGRPERRKPHMPRQPARPTAH